MTIKETASKAGETVRETYQATRDRAEGAYETAAQKTTELYASAREQASVAGQRTVETVKSNPLAAVAGGLGLGLLVGALLPRTKRETELIGPYGGEITGRAREAASAAKAVGQAKLDELGFVKEQARETAQKVIDEAKAAASEASSAAARKARGED